MRELLFAPVCLRLKPLGPPADKCWSAMPGASGCIALSCSPDCPDGLSLFFKILGILLFLVEILFSFACLSGGKSGLVESSCRICPHRSFAVTMSVLGTMLLLACLPWASRVAIPGCVTKAGSYTTVYPRTGTDRVGVGACRAIRCEPETLVVPENPNWPRMPS